MDFFVLKLFLLFIVIYFLNKRDWTSPAILFSISFLVSGLVFSISSVIWNYSLSFNTENVILGGLAIFCLGGVIANFLPNRRNNIKSIKYIGISDSYMRMIIVFCLLLPLFRALDIIAVTGSFNIFGGLGEYRAREASSIFAKLISIIGPICNAIMIIMVVIIVNNYLEKKQIKKSYYIPIISYFIASALSSSRIDIIYMFINFVLVYLIVNRVKTKKNLQFKQIKYVLGAAIILSATFFSLGFMTGKSQKQENVSSNLAMYAGSSFAALDYYLDGFNYKSDNFGKETFVGLSNLYSWIGVKRIAEGGSLEFVGLGTMEHSTNVYTCFRPLIHDYDYIGMLIVLFLEGFFFQVIYRKTKIDIIRGRLFWLVFYTYAATYLMLSSIAERVFSCLLTLTSIMFVFSLFYLKKIVKVYDE